MAFQQAIKEASLNPKRLFLVDGLGALLSAFLLGVVLVKWESTFGIPRSALYILAALPIFFALYDFYCFLRLKERLAPFLMGIAYINLLYCCISMAFALYHFQELTYLGWLYIIVEIIIVVFLAMLELKTAEKLATKN